MHFLKWTDYLKRLSEQRCVCLHCICSESFLATDLLSIWKIGNVKSPPVPGWMGFDMRSAALKMFPGRCKTHSPKNLQTKYTWAVWRANTITQINSRFISLPQRRTLYFFLLLCSLMWTWLLKRLIPITVSPVSL